MKYTNDYIKDSIDTFTSQFEEDYEVAEYTIEVDTAFRDPPIIALCKFMQDTGNLDLQDLMIRHCVLDRMVTIYLDGENVGSFRLNTLMDSWDVIPVLNQHPKAYKMIADIVTGYLAKKFTLPRKKTNAPAATATRS